MRQVLVKYSEWFGRMGSLEETFVTTEPELRALKAIGECYRGEVLGKHSEITSTLSDDTLKVICDDQDWIARGQQFGVLSGSALVGQLLDGWGEDGFAADRWDAMRRALSAEDLAFVCDAWGLSCD